MNTPFLSSDEYDERAHDLYEAGQYTEALEILREGVERFPDSAELHIGLGYVRVAREEYAWARYAFERALEIDPEHEDALIGLGETLLRFGEFEAGLSCFDRVSRLGLDTDPEIGLAMGRALYREGLFEESRNRFAALVQSHPEEVDAVAGYGAALHAAGDPARAAKLLAEALRLDPDHYEACVHLGHILADQGDETGALRAFVRVPADMHWDIWTVERILDLSGRIGGREPFDPRPYRRQLARLKGEDEDPVERLLREVEQAAMGDPGGEGEMHRVKTTDGRVFSGTWSDIVLRMRDELAHGDQTITDFMRGAAEEVRKLTGRSLPWHDPEAFVRASERLGLLRIES